MAPTGCAGSDGKRIPDVGGDVGPLTPPANPARAIYDATAAVYAKAVGTEVSPAFEAPLDRAFLAAFAELVAPAEGLVADLGCGPGRVAAFLATRGLDVVGVDMSLAMLAVGREAHPVIPFTGGALAALPLASGSLGGIVCWYSIIHTPADHLDEVLTEVARVLAPGARVLVAFQAGDGEAVHRSDAYGTGLALTSYRHSIDDVARRMVAAGLNVHARAVREPELAHETTQQAFLIAG